MFPPLFLGGMMDEPAGPSAPAAPPAPMAPPPAPIQRVASQGPSQPPQWLQALPALFAIGARLGGSPTTGTGALLGAQQADVMAERQRAQRVAEDQRQQQIGMQQQQMLMQQQAVQERIEQQKQAAIGRAVDDLRVQPFKNRAEYEQAVTAYENLINQQYPIRPNTLRTLVPFKAPDVQGRAYKAVETLTKQDNWQDIVATNGLITFDRDGDGTPESVKVSELIELGNFPIATDPQTGKPMLPPKEVKAENVQDFDLAYQGVLGEWQAEGKNVNDPVVKGKAATEARLRLGKASRQATTSIVMPAPVEKPMTRYQRFTAEQSLRRDADKAAAPVREIMRQVETMRAGLDQARRGRRTAGVQAVINSFNRILEPGSVTREAEYLRTAAGQPLLDALRGKYEAITAGGQGVTIQTLEDAVALAEQIADNMAGFADQQFTMIGGQADEFQVPKERVIPVIPKRRPGGGQPSVNGPDLRARARQILQQGGYDTSDGAVDKFLANPKNKALLGGGQ